MANKQPLNHHTEIIEPMGSSYIAVTSPRWMRICSTSNFCTLQTQWQKPISCGWKYLGDIVIHASTEAKLMCPLHDISCNCNNRKVMMDTFSHSFRFLFKFSFQDCLAYLTIIHLPFSDPPCCFITIHLLTYNINAVQHAQPGLLSQLWTKQITVHRQACFWPKNWDSLFFHQSSENITTS